MSSMFEIIDVTLRDGSNAVDYQFSIEDTKNIVKGLEKGGIKWAEIGHGLGLGATQKTRNKAACSDEEYILAAKKVAKDIKIGCFFIHTIGSKQDIDKAVDCGLDFIRIGPNADMEEIRQSGEYMAYAKSKGLIVHCCVRKAYAVTPEELAKQAKIVATFGTDAIIIMDSAGTLLPRQAKEYIHALKNETRSGTGMKIGYHAHDNLFLSVACSLAAVEAGADYIDSCLKGLGRSAGNAPTEVLAAVLKRIGYEHGNFLLLQDTAEEYIGNKAMESLDSASLSFGYAGFHSAFYSIVKKVAEKYDLDPRMLVIEVCRANRLSSTEALVENIAKTMIQ